MDQRSFDRLARLLGEATDRRAGLKAALGALLGAGGAAAALEMDAEAKKRGKGKERDDGAGPDAEKRKKRKKTCKPACGTGYECVKQGKKRVCVCASGVECGGACCLVGQTCEGETCVAEPEPTTCIAFGEPCKNVGKRCCDGLSCASGQDGSFPVACYKSKGAACASTAECPFGMSCTGGVCRGNGGGSSAPTGEPCAAGTTCDQPGATCTAYTTAGAPGGTFCTLPLRQSCSGDVDCTCYTCWYSNAGGAGGSRSGRASGNTKACCHMPGQACSDAGDCCSGLFCTNNVCGGTLCVPEGGSGCSADVPCCGGNTCNPDGTCSSGPKPLGASCSADDQCLSGLCWYPQDADGYPVGYAKVCVVAVGEACPTINDYAPCGLGNYCGDDNTCTDDDGSYPLVVPPGGTGCDEDAGPYCYSNDSPYSTCIAGTCIIDLSEPCDEATTGAFCAEGSTCRRKMNSADTKTYCLLPNNATCDYGYECASGKCATIEGSDICVECITDAACEKIKGAPDTCKRWSCNATTRACDQVAATNTLCTLTGGATGFCQANATCGATTATCDVTSGNAADLLAAINNAPYKSAVTVKGTYAPTAQIELKKQACRDNSNPDTDAQGVGNCGDKVPWDLTLVQCSDQTAAISGGSTVSNTAADPTTWSWTGGHRVFALLDYSLTMHGVTLQNGNADFGGGIRALWSGTEPKPTLKLENLTVSGCKASQSGGGVQTDSIGQINLTNVSFTNNWASKHGGGVQIKGTYSGHSIALDDVTMSGNVANDAKTTANCSGFCQGAGIFLDGTVSGTCSGTNSINNANMSYYSTSVTDCAPANSPSDFLYDPTCGCATRSA